MTLVQNTVGPQQGATSAVVSQRAGPNGELITADGGLRYAEATRLGQLFTASTINTGVTIASLTLTTTAPTSLHNPAGSGKNILLKSLTMGYVSGTLGTGQFFLVGHFSTTAPTGTAATYSRPTLVGSGAAPVGVPLYTSTVPAGGVVMRNLWISTPILASSVFVPTDLIVEFEGSIGVAPGYAVSLQGITAAGSTPLAVFTWCWQEVPIV